MGCSRGVLIGGNFRIQNAWAGRLAGSVGRTLDFLVLGREFKPLVECRIYLKKKKKKVCTGDL